MGLDSFLFFPSQSMNSLYFCCMGVSESQVSLKESAKPLLCVFVVVVVFVDIFKFYISRLEYASR